MRDEIKEELLFILGPGFGVVIDGVLCEPLIVQGTDRMSDILIRHGLSDEMLSYEIEVELGIPIFDIEGEESKRTVDEFIDLLVAQTALSV